MQVCCESPRLLSGTLPDTHATLEDSALSRILGYDPYDTGGGYEGITPPQSISNCPKVSAGMFNTSNSMDLPSMDTAVALDAQRVAALLSGGSLPPPPSQPYLVPLPQSLGGASTAAAPLTPASTWASGFFGTRGLGPPTAQDTLGAGCDTQLGTFQTDLLVSKSGDSDFLSGDLPEIPPDEPPLVANSGATTATAQAEQSSVKPWFRRRGTSGMNPNVPWNAPRNWNSDTRVKPRWPLRQEGSLQGLPPPPVPPVPRLPLTSLQQPSTAGHDAQTVDTRVTSMTSPHLCLPSSSQQSPLQSTTRNCSATLDAALASGALTPSDRQEGVLLDALSATKGVVLNTGLTPPSIRLLSTEPRSHSHSTSSSASASAVEGAEVAQMSSAADRKAVVLNTVAAGHPTAHHLEPVLLSQPGHTPSAYTPPTPRSPPANLPKLPVAAVYEQAKTDPACMDYQYTPTAPTVPFIQPNSVQSPLQSLNAPGLPLLQSQGLQRPYPAVSPLSHRSSMYETLDETLLPQYPQAHFNASSQRHASADGSSPFPSHPCPTNARMIPEIVVPLSPNTAARGSLKSARGPSKPMLPEIVAPMVSATPDKQVSVEGASPAQTRSSRSPRPPPSSPAVQLPTLSSVQGRTFTVPPLPNTSMQDNQAQLCEVDAIDACPSSQALHVPTLPKAWSASHSSQHDAAFPVAAEGNSITQNQGTDATAKRPRFGLDSIQDPDSTNASPAPWPPQTPTLRHASATASSLPLASASTVESTTAVDLEQQAGIVSGGGRAAPFSPVVTLGTHVASAMATPKHSPYKAAPRADIFLVESPPIPAGKAAQMYSSGSHVSVTSTVSSAHATAPAADNTLPSPSLPTSSNSHRSDPFAPDRCPPPRHAYTAPTAPPPISIGVAATKGATTGGGETSEMEMLHPASRDHTDLNLLMDRCSTTQCLDQASLENSKNCTALASLGVSNDLHPTSPHQLEDSACVSGINADEPANPGILKAHCQPQPTDCARSSLSLRHVAPQHKETMLTTDGPRSKASAPQVGLEDKVHSTMSKASWRHSLLWCFTNSRFEWIRQ
jgi:hypothetical protein